MRPVIYVDTRQKAGKHAHKDGWFEARGVQTVRRALEFGDYMADGSNVSVDTKASLDEMCSNICGSGAEHARVRREMVRAANAGYRLVFLLENDLGYESLGDVLRWENGRCRRCGHRLPKGPCDPRDGKGKCALTGNRHRKPAHGERLYKTMETMAARYGAAFEPCPRERAAERICELLGVTVDG